MIRIFARRPFVVVALAMCLGIYFVVKCLEWGNLALFLVIMFALCLLVGLSFVLDALKTKNRVLKFISTNRWIWFFSLLLYVVGGMLSFVKITNFTSEIPDKNYAVVGVVDSINDKYSKTTIVLKDVEITENYKTTKLKGGLELEYYSNLEFEKGNVITFTAKILPNYPIENGNLNYYDIKNDVRYIASSVDESNIDLVSIGKLGFKEGFRQNILNGLLKEMPDDVAYLSFSILFGDSSYLSDFTNESFKISGVSHIVAVSGMNVVIIVTILLFLMKFVKRFKFVKFTIITLVLFGYCYLCDFTPSVVRATIMALVLLSASFLRRQNDILSSLGLSAMLICMIWPLSIFDAGFLLSFGSVIGIVLFCNGITKFLNEKCKLPNAIASAIAVTVSAQIGIYPIMASFFNSFSVYSVIANIVVVPVFSLAYILLFSSVCIVVIFPFMSFIYFAPSVVMSFVNWFPSLFVDLPFAMIYVRDLGLFSLIYYVALLFMSSFVFVKHKVKIPVSIALVVAMLVAFIVDLLPARFKRDSLLKLDTYSNCALVTTTHNEKILVGIGSTYDPNKIKRFLESKRIYNLDAVILVDDNVNAYSEISNLWFISDYVKISRVVVTPYKHEVFSTLKFETEILENDGSCKLKNAKIYPLNCKNELVGLILDLENVDYALIHNIDEAQAILLKTMLDSSIKVHCFDKKDEEYFVKYDNSSIINSRGLVKSSNFMVY